MSLSLDTATELNLRARSLCPNWPESSCCVSSLMTLISLCFAACGPEMRAKNEVCQLCSAGSWELLAGWLAFALQLFQPLVRKSSKKDSWLVLHVQLG